CLTYFLSCETSKYGVPGPFEYRENALHAFFMMKNGSGQHLEMEELKKNSNANAYKCS
ncbi:unnamed protein product, partial [Staurois parvus]